MLENSVELTPCQEKALKQLKSGENTFLSGGAGTGKSFLIKHFHKTLDPKAFPILASTGAASVLVGGRTFHSFFGLGILEGGVEKTVEKALGNKRLVKRLQKVQGVIIDEVSMLSSEVLQAAEEISRLARSKDSPWGGLQVIVVGDFAQLPPVTRGQAQKDWAFLDPVWQFSDFKLSLLREQTRCKDKDYMEILEEVREGRVTDRVKSYLDSKLDEISVDVDLTRLFPRKNMVSDFNNQKLEEIESEEVVIESVYSGAQRFVDRLTKMAPVPPQLRIKVGAYVMTLQNDPKGRFVNGSTGYVKEISNNSLILELVSGKIVEVEKTSFSMLDAEGETVATLTNFPVNLAWSTTIHKSQGQTLDKVYVDLRRLWEPGQAYVALSRIQEGEGLYLRGWDPSSIKADHEVLKFYEVNG